MTAAANERAIATNDKINVACTGIQGRVISVIQSFAAEPDCDITHVCDVWESIRSQRGAEMKERTGRVPKLVNDYRTLLDNKSVYVLMVATSDPATLASWTSPLCDAANTTKLLPRG